MALIVVHQIVVALMKMCRIKLALIPLIRSRIGSYRVVPICSIMMIILMSSLEWTIVVNKRGGRSGTLGRD